MLPSVGIISSLLMKIAVFSDNFYPELSGISDSLVEQARELSRLGHSITFCVPSYSPKDYAVVQETVGEQALGKTVSVHRLLALPYPTPTKQGRMAIPSLLHWLSLRQDKPDLIHTHLFFGAGFEALAASFFLRRPLIGTSHTPLTEFLSYGPFRFSFFKKFALHFVAWYYNRCDYVTAPSQGILDEMKRYGFRQPCRVISNPIDLDHFFPTTPEERIGLKNQFHLSSFTILYTGRLAAEKHIDNILHAVALLKETIPELTFALTGHGDALDSLRTLASKLGISDRVRFFGTVSSADHASIYRASDIFAIMSTAETQSLSMMKAMASGIPVIGARARGLAEYIVDNKNGLLVTPGDSKTLAEKILYLYKHPDERHRLGQGGITTVAQFSRATIAKEWETLYQDIVADKKK